MTAAKRCVEHYAGGFLLALTAGIVALDEPAMASEKSYILCTIDRTYDEETKLTSATSGSDTYVIEKMDDGTTTYTFPQNCVEGTVKSKIDELSIWMTCDANIPNVSLGRYVSINRVSGEYMTGLSPKDGRPGVVHLGTCRRGSPAF